LFTHFFGLRWSICYSYRQIIIIIIINVAIIIIIIIIIIAVADVRAALATLLFLSIVFALC